jgi:hypothetical protein
VTLLTSQTKALPHFQYSFETYDKLSRGYRGNVQMNFYNDLDGLTVSRIYVNGDVYDTGAFPMSSGEDTTLTGLSHNSGLVGLQINYNYLSQNRPKYIYVYVDGVLDISPYTSTDITFTIGQTVPVQNNSEITGRQYSIPL